MSVFVDTGVFYAHQNESAERHDDAERALDRVLDGEHGQPFTSDYVYDEIVTLTLSRTGSFDEAWTVGARIREGPVLIEFVDRELFDRSVELFDTYSDHGLSFTDATTLAVMEDRKVDVLLSFDEGFDGIVERIA